MLNLSPEKQNLIYLAFFTAFSVIEDKDNIDCTKLQGLGSTAEYSLNTSEIGTKSIVNKNTQDIYLLQPTNYGYIVLNQENKPIIDIKSVTSTEVSIIALETGGIFNVKRIDHKVEFEDALTELLVPVEMASVSC